ncbi:MAG: hypothetical protein DI596_01815 [Azospira oryzae]|nr:MAG: hypothetical protein DI596_01815 [Azospira oryzae]PZP82469.1 MAG: hypothetical protein DI593_01815 [Azospira oryzae]
MEPAVKRSVRASLLAALALAAGCAVPPGGEQPSPAFPAVMRPLSDVEALLDYYERLTNLQGPELAKEHERARQAYAKTRSDYHRLQLALYGALPNAGAEEQMQSLNLLEPLVKSSEHRNADLRRLALLLHGLIQEQRRLGESLNAASQKAKEEQKRADNLQQKLDALKSIEKNLIEREQRMRRRR